MDTDRFLAEKLGIGFIFDQTWKVWFHNGEWWDPWHPSTDISQCFEYVVAKMRERGFLLMLLCKTDGYSACLVSENDTPVSDWFKSANPATAICEAARAALEAT